MTYGSPHTTPTSKAIYSDLQQSCLPSSAHHSYLLTPALTNTHDSMDVGMFNSTKPDNVPTQPGDANDLTWVNVGIGFLFILFDAVLSTILGLGIGRGLIVAACRCIIQLTVMSKVLGTVFESNNIFAVFGIALLLENLAAIEGTFNKAKRRYTGMVSVVSDHRHCASMAEAVMTSSRALKSHPDTREGRQQHQGRKAQKARKALTVTSSRSSFSR